MAKYVVIHFKPRDIKGFEGYYHKYHLQIIKKLPNVKNVEVNRVVNVKNTEENLYLYVVIEFNSLEDLNNAFSSEVGKELAKNGQYIFEKYLYKKPKIIITE